MKIVWIYLAIINIFAFALTAYDKHAAKAGKWRVRELTLIAVSIVGGAVAMLLAMMLMRHKTRKLKFMAGIPAIIALQTLFMVFGLNHSLDVRHLAVESGKVGGNMRLALVTDFHSCWYGDGQRGLIDAIDRENPDAVLLCGDIFDDDLPPGNTMELLSGIAGRYPCYYVTGNHELWSGKADELKEAIAAYGIAVLEGTTEGLEIRGETISISGVDDPDTDRYPSSSPPYAQQLSRLSEGAGGGFRLLLSHRPDRIHEYLPLGFDLVVSGHAHGGQWRIPFILENGLLAPNQGFFPKYTNGAYAFGDTTLIVSRGLARESTILPRIFNRPELIIITVTAP